MPIAGQELMAAAYTTKLIADELTRQGFTTRRGNGMAVFSTRRDYCGLHNG
jgi:hypothetical protein